MRLALYTLLALALCAGCSKKPAPPHRTEPWLAQPSASASSVAAAPLDLQLAAESRIHFSVPGRKARPSGSVPLSSGELHLDLRDLKSARARIDADLSKLELEADSVPAEAALGDDPSAVARQWLELGRDVPRERREQFVLARFELTSLENLSAATLDLSAKRPGRVRATAIGTLLVHGFRAPVRADVTLEALPSAPGGPLRLAIRSAGPLVLPLGPHDIAARGPSGTADPLQTARAESSIGKSVHITLELVAVAPAAASK